VTPPLEGPRPQFYRSWRALATAGRTSL